MKETSKLYIRMGAQVGINNPLRSHRGIIAKRFMPKIERYEMAEFEKSMVNLTPKTLKVNHLGKTYYI